MTVTMGRAAEPLLVVVLVVVLAVMAVLVVLVEMQEVPVVISVVAAVALMQQEKTAVLEQMAAARALTKGATEDKPVR